MVGMPDMPGRPPYETIEEMAAHQAHLMGRPIKVVYQHEAYVNGEDIEHRITFLVYDASRDDPSLGHLPQMRWAVFVDGRPQTSGLVDS